MRLRPYQLIGGLVAVAMLVAMPAMAQAQRGDEPTPQPHVPGHATFAENLFSIQGQPSSATSTNQLQIWGANNLVANDWRLINRAGSNSRFEIVEGFDTQRAVMLKGGNFGIGNTDPSHRLTVQGPGTNQLRLIGPGFVGSQARLNFGDADFVFIDEPTDDRLRIHSRLGTRLTGGGTGAGPGIDLLTASTSGVGIGTSAPAADLHVNNFADPSGSTVIRFTNPGAGTWANAVRPNGVFAFNQVAGGSPNGEAMIVRHPAHAFSTLQVRGPIGATEFKIQPLAGTAEAREMREQGINPRDGISLYEKIQELEERIAELEAR